jgi:HEPN domain-containing protein
MSAKANEWQNWAKADLTAAELLQKFEDYQVTILAFHCQQAIEKSLKAFLTAKDAPFLFRHDLGCLLDLCSKIDVSFEELES